MPIGCGSQSSTAIESSRTSKHDQVQLHSRRGLQLAATFPRLAAALSQQAGADMILDGEIVAFDANGKPSFNALQNRFQLKTEREIAAADQNTPVVFCCFDMLHFAGVNLRDAAYRDRRRYLSQCLLPSPLVQLVHAEDDGVALHAAALASGFEGVIGKRKDSTYLPGRRSSSWLKIKPTQSADFVVGGYTKGKGSRQALGALLIGYWERGKLIYASHVGSGFDGDNLAQVKSPAGRTADRQVPFHQETGPAQPDHLGRAETRRRSEFPELDRRRFAARTDLPAPARRRRRQASELAAKPTAR